MIGITLTTDQIRNALKEVRQWIEHAVIASLGLDAEAPSPSANASRSSRRLKRGRSGRDSRAGPRLVAGGQRVLRFRPVRCRLRPPAGGGPRLIDIPHQTKLRNIGQVLACLEAINEAFVPLRGTASVRSCGFDNERHCFEALQTQASIAALWQDVIAGPAGYDRRGAGLPHCTRGVSSFRRRYGDDKFASAANGT